MLIVLILLALAYLSWRWSWRTDDKLVAWVRFCLACFLGVLSIGVAVGVWVG